MTQEERAELHKLLDMLIDQGEDFMEYEYFIPENRYTETGMPVLTRRRVRFGVQIKDDEYVR